MLIYVTVITGKEKGQILIPTDRLIEAATILGMIEVYEIDDEFALVLLTFDQCEILSKAGIRWKFV